MLPLGDCFLRFNMAPVIERNDDTRQMTGFVLTIEDIAPEIESDNRMEAWLQNLIDDMEKSLVHVRDAITTILGNPGIEPNELATHRQTIDSESLNIRKDSIEPGKKPPVTFIRRHDGKKFSAGIL